MLFFSLSSTNCPLIWVRPPQVERRGRVTISTPTSTGPDLSLDLNFVYWNSWNKSPLSLSFRNNSNFCPWKYARHKFSQGRRCGFMVQRANSLTGGRAFDPEPRQPLSHSRDWCFTPLPGSDWQVLFDSQHGSIGSERIGHLAKNWWRDSQNPIHKKKKNQPLDQELFTVQ